MVTRTAGVNEFVPEDGKAEEKGWSESNMTTRLLFVECPRVWVICNAQQKKRSPKKLAVKPEKQPGDSLQGVPMLRKNANAQKNAD